MLDNLSFNYHFHRVADELYPRVIREFLDCGVDRFVFQDPLIIRALKDPEYLDFIRKISREMEVGFVSMHAPFGPLYDLNITEEDRRKGMIEDHIRSMRIAVEFGSKTYTIHIGAYHFCTKNEPLDKLRKLASITLEKLIPEAEKLGIVIAVENSFEPTNSASEVAGLLKPFLSSSAIGVCFDTGHANCMASAPWKKPKDYPEYQHRNWSRTGFITEDLALEKLKPYIVTCHMHDNDGYRDLHAMPGDGTIDWEKMIPALESCPHMLEFQTEVNLWGGANWAGFSPAPVGGYSIRRLCETFHDLRKYSCF